MGNFYLFLLIGLLAGLTQTAHANTKFFCWHCDTREYDNCGENFDVSGLPTIDCSKMFPPRSLVNILGAKYSRQNATGCMKTMMSKETIDNDDVKVNKQKTLLCYHCDSSTDPNCGEDFEDSAVYSIDCKLYQMPRHLIHVLETNNRNATGCLKTTTASSALECYSCQSVDNEACGDDKFAANNVHKVDCSNESIPGFIGSILSSVLGGNKKATGCLKTTLNVEGGKKQVGRSCFWGDLNNVDKTCFDPSKITDKVKLECDACADNLCNGAAETTQYGIAVFLAALIGRLLF